MVAAARMRYRRGTILPPTEVNVNENDPLDQARNIVRGCVRRRIADDVDRATQRATYLGLIYGYLASYYAAYPRTPPDGAEPRKAH